MAIIGWDSRLKSWVVKSDDTVFFAAGDRSVGMYGYKSGQRTHIATTSTTYDVAGTGSCNVASINAAVGALQGKVNDILAALMAFGFVKSA